MTTLRVLAGAATVADDRIVSGLLIPYEEVGRTNAGPLKVKAGAVAIPPDPMVVGLNVQHREDIPVGRAVEIKATNAGITARFQVAKTRQGDRLLSEIASGKRNKLSAEFDADIIGGVIVKARLWGASVVRAGAFPSAKVWAADAEDDIDETAETYLYEEESTITETTPDGQQVTSEVTYTEAVTVGQATTDEVDPEVDPESAPDQTATEEHKKEEETMEPIKATAPTSAGPARRGVTIKAASDLWDKMAAWGRAGLSSSSTIKATLDQMVQADLVSAQQPAWLGEIWSKVPYEYRYVDLLDSDILQALKAIGWRFVKGMTPTVGEFAGYPAEVKSTEVKTEPYTVDSKRIAGANEVDRAFIDFAVPGFWEAYYREQGASYKRQLDALVLAFMMTTGNHTPITGMAAPTAVNPAAAMIVDGAIAVDDADLGLPTFALIGRDLWREWALTREEDKLAYLETQLGLEEGTMIGFKVRRCKDASLDGKVMVGTKTAACVHQLPGSPIRVETVTVINGAIQDGVFGYHAESLRDAEGLVVVSQPTPPPPPEPEPEPPVTTK